MTKTIEYMKIVGLFAIAISISYSAPAVAQTLITNDDFYIKETGRIAIFPNGAITTQDLKCNANDIVLDGSYQTFKRDPLDQTPEVDVLSERFKTQPNGITRAYEVQFRVYTPDFVDIKLKVLCLDLQ